MSDTRLKVGQEGVDPLTKLNDASRELFKRFGDASNGFPLDAAVDAAANVILNALRQQQPTKKGAIDALDYVVTVMRQKLDEHYTATGRRSIFPFDQHLVIEGNIMDFAKPYAKG